ncbi:maleate cis-trans isomerase family protein [Sphingosinicella xenopeptidilytica]|uniref:Maleate isomerase n=1 Tax=Sphingosinicella xenopeptidilytica TaxID=364098 RepID=A0ABW3C837_SPHXN
MKRYRIGQIVPSSNTTMETEIPGMLRAREMVRPERFTFHSSRMRMKHVNKEELAAMDAESDRCARELGDARVDVIGYACLVAIMSMGHGYHRASQERLTSVVKAEGAETHVVNSAGALVDGVKVMGAKRIAVLTPYMKPLTDMVVSYLENEGLQVVDRVSLEISNNLDVGAHDPKRLPGIVAGMNFSDCDAIVLSACVQMPSLPVISQVEALTRKPVITAAVATTYAMLERLGLERIVPGAGALLSGAY